MTRLGRASERCCRGFAFPREAICEALKCNCKLTSINLKGNRIGKGAVKARWASERSVLWEGSPVFRKVLQQGCFPAGGDLRSAEDQLSPH